jgi:hypothetical protein
MMESRDVCNAFAEGALTLVIAHIVNQVNNLGSTS